MNFSIQRLVILSTLSVLGLSGCENKPSANAAPVSTALEAAKPATLSSQKFIVDTSTAKASFLMDAPLEKIYGEANQAITGQIFVDLMDVKKSTGLLQIDLLKLTVYQQKRADEKGQFGERVKNDKQNEHMRTWFELSEDVPPMVREKNRWVEFKLMKLESTTGNLNELKGDVRTFTATATGDVRLHQRTVSGSTKLEVTLRYQGEKPVSLQVKTLEPLNVSLDAHDVRPRSAFEKLAEATLASLGPKVASAAPVTLEFSAKAQ